MTELEPDAHRLEVPVIGDAASDGREAG